MSIDKVEATNSRGDVLALTLSDITNGYVVKGIDGLDPVKATIVTSSFAQTKGQQKQSTSRDVRNIVIHLGYAPDYTVDDTVRTLRSRLYQHFMTEDDVSLTFYMTDGLTVTTSGTVESCEAPLFAKEPATDISIVCYDPDFLGDLVQMHTTFTTTDTTPSAIVYDGTTKAGLTNLSFTVATALSEFTIYHTTPSGVLNTMLISAPLLVGDVITMCTVEGQKSITRTSGGVTTSLLWAVSPQSVWVQLEKGTNQFYLHASASSPSAVHVDFVNNYGGL